MVCNETADPGATHSYIDKKIVDKYNITVTPDEQILTVANSTQAKTVGTVNMALSFLDNNHVPIRTSCLAYVLNLPDGFDMLIGQGYNQSYGVNVLNEPEMGCTIKDPDTQYRRFVPCVTVVHQC